jgi:endogenous inhibitor of DNA gyrase (YacG/DUF329 family)
MATSASSSAQPGRTLPLIDCPQCMVPVVKCKSKNDNFYYRCSKRCGNWWFEDAYELYLHDNHPNLLEKFFGSGHNPVGAFLVDQQLVATAVQGVEQCSGDLKMVAFDLKMQLGDIKLEIGNLKTEVKELKDEIRKGKNPIVFDNAGAFVLLAIFVAVLVAIVWRK